MRGLMKANYEELQLKVLDLLIYLIVVPERLPDSWFDL